MAKKYTHIAEITIPSCMSFPIDMLRFDQCWPISEASSGFIADSLYPTGVEEETVVAVMTKKPAKEFKTAFTVARWESFNMKITEVKQ